MKTKYNSAVIWAFEHLELYEKFTDYLNDRPDIYVCSTCIYFIPKKYKWWQRKNYQGTWILMVIYLVKNKHS